MREGGKNNFPLNIQTKQTLNYLNKYFTNEFYMREYARRTKARNLRQFRMNSYFRFLEEVGSLFYVKSLT